MITSWEPSTWPWRGFRQALAEVPRRYLKCIKTDCLVMQDVPKKYRPAVERLLQMSHRDGTPIYRYEEVTGLKGQYREPSMDAEPIRAKPPWRRVEDPVGHCLDGESLLLTGFPGTGKTHLAKKIVEALREHGDTVHIITKTHAAVQNVGLGAQTADHWVRRNVRSGHCSATWLVIEELTQLDTPLWADIACLSMNKKIRFLLLGDFRQLPAVLDSFAGAEVCKELKDSQLLHDLAGGWCHELSERWRFDERIFEFLTWLKVDEPEQVPLSAAVREARRRFLRRGEPDVSLVISHAKRLQINDRENRRLAPADALVVPYEARGAVPTNAPQTMRVWPGLRLIGAGGKVQKGTFLTVEAVEGGPSPPGERAMLRGAGAAEAHSAMQRDHVCFGSGADPEGAGLAVRCGEPALQHQAPLHGLLPGHQFGAFERLVIIYVGHSMKFANSWHSVGDIWNSMPILFSMIFSERNLKHTNSARALSLRTRPFASTQTQATTMSRSGVLRTPLRDIILPHILSHPRPYP